MKRKDFVNTVILPALQPQAFAGGQAADAALLENARTFPFVEVDAGVLPGGNTAGDGGVFRVLVEIHKAQRTLGAVGGQRVGNALADPAAPGVYGGVAQVDAVARVRHFVSFLGGLLDGQPHRVQPGVAAEAACTGGQGAACSVWRVDALSL